MDEYLNHFDQIPGGVGGVVQKNTDTGSYFLSCGISR